MNKAKGGYSNAFKLKVALEAIKEQSTLSELAERFELRPEQIAKWKKEFLENAGLAFDNTEPSDIEQGADLEKLRQKIERLETEKEFLKKCLRNSGL